MIFVGIIGEVEQRRRRSGAGESSDARSVSSPHLDAPLADGEALVRGRGPDAEGRRLIPQKAVQVAGCVATENGVLTAAKDARPCCALPGGGGESEEPVAQALPLLTHPMDDTTAEAAFHELRGCQYSALMVGELV